MNEVQHLLRAEAARAKGLLVLAVVAGLGATAATIIQAYAFATAIDLGGIQRVPVGQLAPWLALFGAAVLLKAGCTSAFEWAGAAGGGAHEGGVEHVARIGPYGARYLPRTWLAVLAPAAFLAVIFPLNWVAGLI